MTKNLGYLVFLILISFAFPVMSDSGTDATNNSEKLGVVHPMLIQVLVSMDVISAHCHFNDIEQDIAEAHSAIISDIIATNQNRSAQELENSYRAELDMLLIAVNKQLSQSKDNIDCSLARQKWDDDIGPALITKLKQLD